jgi:AcrR family transcriptional regulator
VAPNAVYTYFPDKAAVVKALVERLLGEANHDVFADRTQPWRLRVESLALELRQGLTAPPGPGALGGSGVGHPRVPGPGRAWSLGDRDLHACQCCHHRRLPGRDRTRPQVKSKRPGPRTGGSRWVCCGG